MGVGGSFGGIGLGWGVRVDVNEIGFCENSKKKILGGGGGGGGSVGGGDEFGWGGQSGCERRIEVFVKIQKKKIWGGGGGGGRSVGGGGGGSGWM